MQSPHSARDSQFAGCSEKYVAQMDNHNRYVIVRNEAGEMTTNANGQWLVMDIVENTLMYVTPTSAENSKDSTSLQNKQPDDSNKAESMTDPDYNQANSPESSHSHHTWSSEAIVLLIEIYKEHQKFFRDTSVKNDKVWTMIKEKLRANGFYYTNTQIENKFKYLKARYIKKKDNSGSKGSGESPVSFPYYEQFDGIFGKCPNVKPIAIASSLQGSLPSEVSDDAEEEEKITRKKSRLEKQIEHQTMWFSQQNEEKERKRDKRHQEKQEMMERAISVYQSTMEKLIDKL